MCGGYHRFVSVTILISLTAFWYCDFTEGAINVDGSLSGISGSLFGAKFLFYIFCLNVCTFVGYSCIRIFPIHIHSDLATIYSFGSVYVKGKLLILFAQHNEQMELNEMFTRNGMIIGKCNWLE